jgi:hypothetical protein
MFRQAFPEGNSLTDYRFLRANKMNVNFLQRTCQFTRENVAGWRQLTVAAVFGVTLAACAGLTKDSPDEMKVAAVRKQVEGRWAALMAGDAEKAYSYLSTGSKATNPLELYKRKARLSGFREATIDTVDCGQELCRVTMHVKIDTKRVKGLPMPETETWILEGGEYRYVFLQ